MDQPPVDRDQTSTANALVQKRLKRPPKETDLKSKHVMIDEKQL